MKVQTMCNKWGTNEERIKKSVTLCQGYASVSINLRFTSKRLKLTP
jgi:hypothetical protein